MAWPYPVRYTDSGHRHAPVTVPGTFFFGGNANGRYDIVPGSTPPCPDLNGYGQLGPTEDYLLTGLPAYGPATPRVSLEVFCSTPVLEAARSRGLLAARSDGALASTRVVVLP